METVRLTLTEQVKNYLQIQAKKSGLTSPQDYLQSILDELEVRVTEKKDLEALLLEGVRSPTVVADAAFWAERRRKIIERDPELQS